MYKYNIGFALFEHITHTVKDANGNIGQVLSLFHDIQVNVWLDIEYFQHLVKHFTMLTRYTYYCFKFIWMFLKLLYQRTHLDSLRSGSEYKHYFFHILFF